MNCLLLEGGLPDAIDGVAIYPDYRNMIRLEQILADDRLTDYEKTALGVHQLFEELPTGGILRAVERLEWFYLRGRTREDAAAKRAGNGRQAYDLTYDAACIYAGFRQAYGIDLIQAPFLHWWAFLALLENLPEETVMAQKMQLRTMDLRNIKEAKMRERYRELQKQVALPRKAAARSGQVESMADRVKRRYAEAQKELERRRKDVI